MNKDARSTALTEEKLLYPRFRVIVVGDSFTYGEGIDARWTYSAQLERALARDFDVEVLNLGVLGYSSADVAETTRRLLPQLEPDLVVYGVCLNDFVQQVEPEHYTVPLPDKWKKTLVRRTRVGRLVAERYDALLRRLGLRRDFYGELLARLDAERARFARDVAALNAFVVEPGGRPSSRSCSTTCRAPAVPGTARAGGGIRAARRRRRGDRQRRLLPRLRRPRLPRQPLEGHPNEEAHALAVALRARCERAPISRATGADSEAAIRSRSPGRIQRWCGGRDGSRRADSGPVRLVGYARVSTEEQRDEGRPCSPSTRGSAVT